MDFLEELTINIKAGAPIVQIISHETLRIQAACQKVANELKWTFYIWNRVKGLQRSIAGNLESEEEERQAPTEVLDWIEESASIKTERFLVLLEDFHPDLTESQPHIINRLRNFAIAVAKRQIQECCIVLSQPLPLLPVELEKEVQVLEMPLPSVTELTLIMRQTRDRFDDLLDREYQESPRLLEAALGLSTSEAQLAFARAVIQKNRLTESEIPLIVSEKEQIIRKSGHLEYFHPNARLDDIGGLDRLKSWLQRRKLAFTEEAREFGLEAPRGVLLLGLPGTGKSLAAKAVANAWQLPLLRLDMGRIYGGIVGQSEENMRNALRMAEALSPSILWVDEIEKGLSGMQSSGSTDGGTTARVLGSFLTWMQEKKKPVFVVATANHIAQLPPELLRKGRVDEIFFVDLPVETDRAEILKIHLRARGHRDEDFSDQELMTLAGQARGFTGAELEEVVKEALFLAFDQGRQLRIDDMKQAIADTTPLSQTMHELIQSTRAWARGRAVPASSKDAEVLINNPDVKTPRLRQEGENPFI